MDSCLNLCCGVNDFLYESQLGNDGDDTGVSISPFVRCNEESKELITECPLKNWSVVHSGGVGVFANGGMPPRWIGLDPSGDPWLCCGDMLTPCAWETDMTSDGLANWSPKLLPICDVNDTGTEGLVNISVGAAPVIRIIKVINYVTTDKNLYR